MDKAGVNLWIFARQLRLLGLRLSVEDVIAAGDALRLRGDFSFAAVHQVLSAVWVRSYHERSIFDQAYSAYAVLLLGRWDGDCGPHSWLRGLPGPQLPGARSLTWIPEGAAKDLQTSEQTLYTRNARASFTELTPPAVSQTPQDAGNWRERLRNLPKCRRLSFRRVSARRGEAWDLAKVIRRQARSPELVTLWRWRRTHKVQAAWFLWDCSRSMEGFIPVYFPFFRALAAREAKTRIYAFSTRISDITAVLKGGTDQESYQQIFAPARYLRTGTRLSGAMAALAQDLGHQGGSHTNVVLVTDGFDAGSVAELANTLLKVSRRAHRLIWWNPWLNAPGYAPLAPACDLLARRVHNMEAASSLNECVTAWSRLC